MCCRSCLNRQGINIGETTTLLYAQVLLGRKYIYGKKGEITLEKQWSTFAQPFPIQVTVKVNQSPLSFLNISLPWFNFLFNGYNGLTNNHQLTYKQTMFSHFYRTYQYVDPHLNKSIPLMNSTPRTPKCSTWGFPTMVA